MSIEDKDADKVVLLVDNTARLVAKEGREYEEKLMSYHLKTGTLTFLSSSDPDHAYYQKMLSEYRRQPAEPFALAREPLNLKSLPEGITRKELRCIKLTTLFFARYGGFFSWELINRVGMEGEFGFLKPTDNRYKYYTEFYAAYIALIKWSEKPDATPKVLVDGFFHLLQEAEEEEEEGMEKMFDLGVLEYLANIGDKDRLPAGHLFANRPTVPASLLEFPSVRRRMQPTTPQEPVPKMSL
ncbi:probable splicing factor 3A subunit 1 [Eutrema salsugineum]|nr:probable splicing factor 3A subunit 1 [Eutrema salsugineum]